MKKIWGVTPKVRRRKEGVLRNRVIPIVAVCALALSVLLAVTGCGKEAETKGSPDTVVVRFFEASLAKDADTAYGLLSRESQGEVEDKKELVEGFAEIIDSYSAGHPEVSGEKARVPVILKLKAFEQDLEFDMILVTEDGAWRIDLPESEVELEKAMERFFQEVEPPS